MAKKKENRYVALYERLSHDDEQQGESNSISNQKRILEDYALSHGMTVLQHFTDDGISGTRFDRPGFQAMIDEVREGNIEACIIKDAYGIIGLNSKDSINKGFSGISPILFSPQKRLTVELRRCHAQIKDFSAKRPAAGMHSSIAGSIIPFCVLQRQSDKHIPDVDLHRSTVRYPKDVSLACTA